MIKKHKHKDHDKECHWHLTKKDESSDHHHCEDESSSSSSSSSSSWDPPKQDHCIKDVLKAILHAQRKVKTHKECETSCKESIDDLLEEKKKWKKNTIPFILYCGCEPFKGTGVTTFKSHSKKEKFVCITSFIFKIKDIDDNCAVLELLTFKNDKKCSSDSEHKCNLQEICSPCCQIDCEKVDDLVKTGICITVDLSCFCAITCFPAVKL